MYVCACVCVREVVLEVGGRGALMCVCVCVKRVGRGGGEQK